MAKKKKFKDQALVFDRCKFTNKRKVKAWLKKNRPDISIKIPITKYKKIYRCRIKSAGKFVRKSLKEVCVCKNVILVRGRLK